MYNKTQHSVYSITLRLVLVIKYRKKVINDEISNRIKEIFSYIGKSHGVDIVEWNHDIDHIHTIISIKPDTNLNKYINASKSASSRLIKKEYSYIKKQLWKEYFWTKGFFVTSTGSTQLDVVKNYISKQGDLNNVYNS